MIVGLDKSFKPEWVYRILQLSKPGLEYKELEHEFRNIIEFNGSDAKRKVLTIIKRYYLEFKTEGGKVYIKENYLHNLSLKYSFETLKPLLLFVLLSKCEIASFIQNKINIMFSNIASVDSTILSYHVRKYYGDRKVVLYAVNYYLTILSNFDILDKSNSRYKWKTRKMDCIDYIIKDMILIYAKTFHKYEIGIILIKEDVRFSLFNIDILEDVLKEYNSVDWMYQKRLEGSRVIITSKI